MRESIASKEAAAPLAVEGFCASANQIRPLMANVLAPPLDQLVTLSARFIILGPSLGSLQVSWRCDAVQSLEDSLTRRMHPVENGEEIL